jgi:hypothetical protein
MPKHLDEQFLTDNFPILSYLYFYRLAGEDIVLFPRINSIRWQLWHCNVFGEQGQPGRSLESSGW